MRRKTSVSVRTVVVFPVPPFWLSTAMVVATRGSIEWLRGGRYDEVSLFANFWAPMRTRTADGGVEMSAGGPSRAPAPSLPPQPAERAALCDRSGALRRPGG